MAGQGSEPGAPEPEAPLGLFDGLEARGPVRTALADPAWLAALLEVEAALARAEALVGLIASADAAAIGAACRPERYDLAGLGRAAMVTGNPVVPLVAALRAEVAEGGVAGQSRAAAGRAADAVHLGATSQDILDTATMLVARRALALIEADLAAASSAAAGFARGHRDTPMAGRTLLQQAVPTTFGLVAAGWLAGLDTAVERLRRVRQERLAVQLGGAAGTLAALGARGPAVVAALAADLGLAEPIGPWHTERSRVAELAGALGLVAGVVAKPALDVVLLAQTEIAEVREGRPDRGGSSTLPQKHNPVAAVATLACARQAPGLVATLLAAMAQEEQRAAGAWHAEWRPLRALLTSVGSAAAWLRDCLEGLVIDPDRMSADLAAGGGLLSAERIVAELTPTLGRAEATKLVSDAAAAATASGRPFQDVLAERPDVAAIATSATLQACFHPLT